MVHRELKHRPNQPILVQTWSQMCLEMKRTEDNGEGKWGTKKREDKGEWGWVRERTRESSVKAAGCHPSDLPTSGCLHTKIRCPFPLRQKRGAHRQDSSMEMSMAYAIQKYGVILGYRVCPTHQSGLTNWGPIYGSLSCVFGS